MGGRLVFCGVLLEFRSRVWIQGGKSGVSSGCVCIEIPPPKKNSAIFCLFTPGRSRTQLRPQSWMLGFRNLCASQRVSLCDRVDEARPQPLLAISAGCGGGAGDLGTSSPVTDSMCCVMAAPHSDWRQTAGLIVSCGCSR